MSNLRLLLRSESPSGKCAKLRTVAASNSRDHPRRSLSSSPLASTINCSPGSQVLLEVTHQDHYIGITLLLLVRATYIYFCSSRTSRSWWITQSTQHHRRGSNNIPSFLQRTTPIARSLCEGWTRHDLHILVTAPFCCDRKTRAASAQSFAPWQQATRDHPTRSLSPSPLASTLNSSPGSQALLEVTHQDHSIGITLLLFVRATYIFVLRAHPVRGESQSTQHHRRGCNTINVLYIHNNKKLTGPHKTFDWAICRPQVGYSWFRVCI